MVLVDNATHGGDLSGGDGVHVSVPPKAASEEVCVNGAAWRIMVIGPEKLMLTVTLADRLPGGYTRLALPLSSGVCREAG